MAQVLLLQSWGPPHRCRYRCLVFVGLDVVRRIRGCTQSGGGFFWFRSLTTARRKCAHKCVGSMRLRWALPILLSAISPRAALTEYVKGRGFGYCSFVLAAIRERSRESPGRSFRHTCSRALDLVPAFIQVIYTPDQQAVDCSSGLGGKATVPANRAHRPRQVKGLERSVFVIARSLPVPLHQLCLHLPMTLAMQLDVKECSCHAICAAVCCDEREPLPILPSRFYGFLCRRRCGFLPCKQSLYLISSSAGWSGNFQLVWDIGVNTADLFQGGERTASNLDECLDPIPVEQTKQLR